MRTSPYTEVMAAFNSGRWSQTGSMPRTICMWGVNEEVVHPSTPPASCAETGTLFCDGQSERYHRYWRLHSSMCSSRMLLCSAVELFPRVLDRNNETTATSQANLWVKTTGKRVRKPSGSCPRMHLSHKIKVLLHSLQLMYSPPR